MAQDRDSLKSPAEIYADEVVRRQLSYWRTFAAQVQAQQTQQTAAATTPATTTATNPDLPVMLAVAGGFVLLLILRR